MREAAMQFENATKERFTGDAHKLLMMVYKNQQLPIMVRLDAAKAAIRFEKARMLRVRGIQ